MSRPIKRYSHARVPWHTHFYRGMLACFIKGETAWHTHLYRGTRSLMGDRRYAMPRPAPKAPLPVEPPVVNAKSSEIKRPKIVMYVQDYKAGGLERMVHELSTALLPRYEITILVDNEIGPIAHHSAEAGIPVHALHGDTAALRTHLLKLAPSAIITHHAYDALDTAISAGIPVVEVIHNLYFWQRGNHYLAGLRADGFARIIAVSAAVMEFTTTELGVPADRITCIPNGLNAAGLMRATAPMRRHMRTAALANRFEFVHVANFYTAKRHEALVRAFALTHKRHPQTHLTLFGGEGTPGCRTKIQNLIAELGLADAIAMPGAVDRETFARHCLKAHVALLPSLFEGFSVATLEYMHLGLPQILTDVGAARDIISDGDIGRIIPAVITSTAGYTVESTADTVVGVRREDIGILSDTMNEAVENYDAWFERGERAVLKSERFTIHATAAAYEAVLSAQIRIR